MTKENQKILYDNFKRLSVEGSTDIQRKHNKEYAADILKSFPDFEKKSEKPETAKEKAEREKAEAAKSGGQ